MKILDILKRLIREYIHPGASVIYETNLKGKDFIFYDSPHLYEIRKDFGTVRLKDMSMLIDICKSTVFKLYTQYYRMNTHYREIDEYDPKKIRFGVVKKFENKDVMVIMQIEKFDRKEGFIIVVITIFDEEGITPRSLERNYNPRFFLEV